MSDKLYPEKPVLLVDDEAPWLRSLSMTLRGTIGFNNIIKCSDSRDVIQILKSNVISIVLLDLTMPHFSGQDLLQLITKDFPEIPVIILSGLNQVDTAVNCMKLGAFDYHVKTVETERLIYSIHHALSTREMHDENLRLKSLFLEDKLEYPDAFTDICTCSKKMRAVFQYCEAVAHSSEPILIYGESGVGKELIARAIHKIRSPNESWLAVNVAGLDDNAFSDTLFGHTKGAFTGAERVRRGMIEEAAGGTLFLDEIGDLNPTSQVKLLRLLQEGEYFPLGADRPRRLRAKLVFATNSDLTCQTAKGTFRKDLYYRLSTHQVRIPPLRERLDDLEVLIHKFVSDASTSFGKKVLSVPKGLTGLLSNHDFPGNVRELRAMIFNAVSLSKSDLLPLDSFMDIVCPHKELQTVETLDSALGDNNSAASPQNTVFPELLPSLEEAGHQLVSEAMRRAHGNQTLAASTLGITRQGLAKRLKKQPDPA